MNDNPQDAEPGGAAREMTLQDAIRAAQHMQRHGDLDRAESVYQAILKALPQQPDALHFLGLLRLQQDRFDDAVALIHQAIEQVPRDAGMWLNLGNVLLEAKRFDEAVDAYKRASELAPDSLMVYNNLGLLQSRRGNLELAEGCFKHALALAPEADYVLNNYAHLLQRTGRYELATSYGLKALSVSPEDPRARRLLSISYALAGDLESARGVLRDWLELDPGNPEAEHLLAGAGGLPTPPRASDAYIRAEFDTFARAFDAKLESLGYRAPELVAALLRSHLGADGQAGDVLDAGCGTGLCSVPLRPMARRLDGVDLSRGMLDKAAARGGYDSLEQAELAAFMAAHPARWDAVVSADTLCYFGDLSAPLQAARVALRHGGLLVFSVEAAKQADAGFVLNHHGRYAHTDDYLRRQLAAAGFELLALQSDVLRVEVMRPVQGWLVLARARGPRD
jgi:predicted TPR repeat methyltransferase